MITASIHTALTYNTPSLTEAQNLRIQSEHQTINTPASETDTFASKLMDSAYRMQEKYSTYIDRMRFSSERAVMSVEMLRLYCMDVNLRVHMLT